MNSNHYFPDYYSDADYANYWAGSADYADYADYADCQAAVLDETMIEYFAAVCLLDRSEHHYYHHHYS